MIPRFRRSVLLGGDGDMEKIRRIPVEHLASSEGLIAEDVMSSDGRVCLLPKGTNLSYDAVRRTLPLVIRQLHRRGIKTLLISQEDEYSLDELQKIVDRLKLPFSKELDRSLARQAASQVGSVYTRIATTGVVEEEDFAALMETGRVLAKEIERVPQVLMSLSDIRSFDEYTYIHSLNVALLAGFMAKKIQPDNSALVETVTVGGLLHDLGKTRVPREILNKPGPLSREEFVYIQDHPAAGEFLARRGGVRNPDVLTFIRHHHERWSGEGYPDKLLGEDIPFVARIASVADVFDALTTKRVYKDACHNARALQMIIENTGTHFEKSIVRTLLSSVGLYPPGSVVELNDGSIGVVVGTREKDLFRPQVLLQSDPEGDAYEEPRVVDLHQKGSDLFVHKVLGSAKKRTFQEAVAL
jgi:putative nucleotidyltransferase with HDIG domain